MRAGQFQPGHKKLGGRTPGVKSKLVAAREGACLRSGLSPIAYLCSVYQDEEQPANLRVEAARAVAQYVYPRVQPVDVNGAAGQPLVVNVLRFAPDLPDALPSGGRQIIEMRAGDAVTDVIVAPVAAALDDEDEDDR